MSIPPTDTQGNISAARTVRWAVLGTGTVASSFAEDIARVPDAVLAAVCSRRMETARAFAARHGAADCLDDIAGLAASPVIDAVYLATPNDAHFEQARQLIEAGKPLLVEKPLAATAAEARTLSGLASARGVFVMEALWTLFLPAIEQVRALIADGAIGRVTAVTADLAYARPFDAESRFFSPLKGGGSLLDLAVYPLALTLNLFGSPDRTGGTWKAAPTGVDMSAAITLSYPDFSASLTCGFERTGGNRFVIHGSKAALVIDAPFLKASRILLVRNGIVLNLATPQGSDIVSRTIARLARAAPGTRVIDASFPGNGLQFEIAAVGQALAEGWTEHPLMPLAASIAALDIIDTVRRTRPPL